MAPTIASFSPDTGTVGDGITSSNVLTLTGSAEANSTVKVYDGATLLGTATANGSGAWSFTTGTLGNSAHTLTATATDAAGNVSAASGALSVMVDGATDGSDDRILLARQRHGRRWDHQCDGPDADRSCRCQQHGEGL